MTAPWLVVSDVDHTLLEHPGETAAVGEALARLRARGIPALLASSKTFAEMVELQGRAGLPPQPFLFENGCGLGWPLAAWASAPPGAAPDRRAAADTTLGDYGAVVRGEAPGALAELLRSLRREGELRFSLLAELSLEAIAARIGLQPELARLALQRLASVPLVWQDTPERLTWLRDRLEARGLRVVGGGKLLHVSGPFDKGEALALLQTWPGLQPWPARLLACGDSDNDRTLLERADLALVFHPAGRGPMTVGPAPGSRRPRAVEAGGPGRWLEAVLEALVQEGALEPDPAAHVGRTADPEPAAGLPDLPVAAPERRAR